MFTLPVCLTSQLTYLKLVSKKRVYLKCTLCDQAILREVLYYNSAIRVGLYYIYFLLTDFKYSQVHLIKCDNFRNQGKSRSTLDIIQG